MITSQTRRHGAGSVRRSHWSLRVSHVRSLQTAWCSSCLLGPRGTSRPLLGVLGLAKMVLNTFVTPSLNGPSSLFLCDLILAFTSVMVDVCLLLNFVYLFQS